MLAYACQFRKRKPTETLGICNVRGVKPSLARKLLREFYADHPILVIERRPQKKRKDER